MDSNSALEQSLKSKNLELELLKSKSRDDQDRLIEVNMKEFQSQIEQL